MLKRVLALLVTLVIIFFALSGCGSSKDSSAAIGNAGYGAQSKTDGNKGETAQTTSGSAEDATGVVGTDAEESSINNIILAERKIIRTANVTIEVDSYEKAYGKIETLVEHSGYGYIQESSVSTEDVDVDGKTKLVKNGMVVVRVDAEKFTQVLNDVKGLGELLDASVKSEDVTDKFYDIESELRLLKYEQSRLEQYLNKVSDPDTIFKTESRLTEIRHQIESLTGNLNKLADLTKLSTITININEKSPAPTPAKVEKEKSFGEKLFGNFSGSVKGVGGFLAALLLFLAQALPVLVVLIIFAWVAFKIYRLMKKKFGGNISSTNENKNTLDVSGSKNDSNLTL